jgi:Rrf2 family protein
MRISARCDYACKALLELSLHWPSKEPLSISAISQRQAIPLRYLVQILIQLKRMGLVESIRGKQGGYRLLKPPFKITLGEVIRRTCGPLLPLAESALNKDSAFETVWKELEQAMAEVVDRITFEDISNKVKGRGAIIYQI